ncbi:MAG: HAMP domain-containing histidine kinase [Cyanobacteria bacterium REEB67]|nr:HAMP domain-containing histidine kinase [Cyanobacteria bacterium REEB67]
MSFAVSERKIVPYRPTINRKLLALALFPVVLGSTFLILLNYLWYSSNELNLSDQHRNELAIALSNSFGELSGYCYTVMDSAFRCLPSSAQRAGVQRRQTEKELAHLEHIVCFRGPFFASEKEIQRAFVETFKLVDRAAVELPAAVVSSNMQRVATSCKLMRSAVILSDKLLTIDQKNLADSLARRKQQDLLQERLELLVWGTFICGSAFAAFLFMDFAKSIVRRLNILKENASSLASLETPRIAINGRDEVAYLDATFRAVSDELQEAREEQHAVVQMIAHDMRSPIMAAQISISTFEEFFVDALPAPALGWCKQVTASSDQVLNFVNDLLTIEALDAGTVNLALSNVSLRQLVQISTLALAPAISVKTLSVRNNCGDGSAWADKNRLNQVITIFLANAVAMAPTGSQIIVSSDSHGEFETLSFHDQGDELSELQAKYVFERFGTVDGDSDDSTSGLGLYIARRLVEKHGGAVAVLPSAGAGRIFQFSLPRSESASISDGRKVPISAVSDQLDEDDAKSAVGPTRLRRLQDGMGGKVLLLILLPIVAQAVLLFWLDGQILQSRKLAILERKQADLVTSVDQLWLRLFRANANSVLFSDTQLPEYGQRTASDIRALKMIVDQLNPAAGNTGIDAALWNDTRQFIDKETTRIEDRIANWHLDHDTNLAHLPDFIPAAVELNTRMTAVSAAVCHSLSALSGQNEEARKQVQNLILLAIASNFILSTLQWWILRRDISTRMALLMANAEKLPLRRRLGAVMGGSDEIASLDEMLHQAAEELRRSDARRQAVMALVERNINSPLETIALNISELESAAKGAASLAADARENLTAARRNIGRVHLLAGNLFVGDDYAGLKNDLCYSHCEVVGVVDDAITSVASIAAESGIKLEADLMAAQVFIDKEKIVQVLVNLLANAIKFSPPQSSILIRAQSVDGILRIIVKDCGPGMDRATVERIFDRFVSAENQSQKAFGLGLAICKAIVEAHGGRIGVQSTLGCGSSFCIELPVTRRP